MFFTYHLLTSVEINNNSNNIDNLYCSLDIKKCKDIKGKIVKKREHSHSEIAKANRAEWLEVYIRLDNKLNNFAFQRTKRIKQNFLHGTYTVIKMFRGLSRSFKYPDKQNGGVVTFAFINNIM